MAGFPWNHESYISYDSLHSTTPLLSDDNYHMELKEEDVTVVQLLHSLGDEYGVSDEEYIDHDTRRNSFKKKHTQFTDAEEEELIDFWSSNPMLYDKKNRDFKDIKKRMQIIDSKAEELDGITGRILYINWSL